MYPAFMLARNAGLRDTEIKTLTWAQLNLTTKTLQVGRAKTDAGAGYRSTEPELYDALIVHRAWFLERFGATNDRVESLPLGSPDLDPTHHVTSLRTPGDHARHAKVNGS